jgi:poly(A) polymerase
VQIPDVPPQLLAALVEAAAGQRLALVGGVVRDLLLHRHHQDPWRGLPDLDLVVEGQAADLVARLPAALEHHFGRAIPLRQQPHGRYGTVELELQLPQELGGSWLVDLASARREVYPSPANNPVVSPGTLEQDLARRDVTVNAMALELDPRGAAEVQLLDPYGGQKDLALRQLRFLHPDSLRDDPTRVVRAARYAARLGFDLAPDALDQITRTLQAWPWSWRPGDSPGAAPPALSTRLRMELDLLVQREPWQQALLLLQSWRALAILDAGLQAREGWRRRLAWARRLHVPLLLAVVAGGDDPLGLGRRLQLPQRWLVQLERTVALNLYLQDLENCFDLTTWMPSQWCSLLEAPRVGHEAVALALMMGAKPRKSFLHWWLYWRHVKGPESASFLVSQGWKPGPELGRELRRRRYQALDKSSILSVDRAGMD